jgi:uncharacterized phiE125 gp8 family phage protein
VSSPVAPWAPWAYPRSAQSVLVEGPSEEPLTLAEGKLRAGLDWPDGDPRDDLMKGFITAARQQVEKDTGLALIKQTRDVTLAIVPGAPVPLPMHALPLIAITETTDGATPARVRIDADRRTLTVIDDPLADAVVRSWRIESGWADAATLKADAPLLVQAVALLVAHFATTGRDAVITGTIVNTTPLGYADAIQPFTLVWVP